MSGLYISNDDLKKLSKDTIQELLGICANGVSYLDDEFADDDTGNAVDLSSGQAIELVKGLSDKSRTALMRAIELIEDCGDGEKSGVWAEDIANAMHIEVDELRGVWSGLTRRTRRVTNDKAAKLFHWLPWDYDREDYFGRLHPTTILNLKRALDM
ncbi:hypothetical protein [Kosakonia sp. MH5]|uniref:hypothetical protein n=1 Tax=Kosakonia sp. MH5 TaxID=2202822 RepID=UPI001374B924|nr:hypothetical protein [Kosakonia sp. MH5]NCF03864.1 hypothetical protein [Kosakonia sp. MH5]